MNVRSAYAEAIAGLNEHRAGLIAEHDRISRRLTELDTALRVLGAMVAPEAAPAFIGPHHESEPATSPAWNEAAAPVSAPHSPERAASAEGELVAPVGEARLTSAAVTQEREDVAGAKTATGEASASPARSARAERCADIIRAHPDWTATEIGKAAGESGQYVNGVAAARGLTIRRVTGKEIGAKSHARARADGVAARLRAFMAEHPDATAGEAADALGIERKAIYSRAIAAGVKFRKLTTEEIAARRAEHRATEQPEPTPQPTPEPETPAEPEPRRPLADDIPPNDGEESRRRKYGEPEQAEPEPPAEAEPEPYVHPSLKAYRAPEGAKWFRLRRDDGAWLHLSGHGFTTDRNHGWIGRIGQLCAIRANAARYPDAQGLRIVAETKPATVAA